MALREEFERSGAWLFRWRSYVPLALLRLVAASLVRSGDLDRVPGDLLWEIGCLGVSMLGLAVRVATVGYAPRGTSGRNTHSQVADVLNTTGMYSIVRHPLYLGNGLMWLGLALYPRLWWLVLIVGLSFWIYYERIMFAEEEFLRRRFGEDFLQWANVTPAFVPRLRSWRSPALPFSVRTVLRREYSGLFGVIAAFTFLELSNGLLHGRTGVEPLWQALFAAGLVVYLTLLTLKRKTRLLHVEGR